MANVLNILRNTLSIQSRFALKSIQNTTLQQSCRSLYSAQALGVDGYIQQRTTTEGQLGNIKDKFIAKMESYTTPDANSMIFTEDLKNMLHIAEVNDIELVINMMKRFNSQNKELRFGSFIFGPVVMRMFHYLNKPDEAYKCFLSDELNGFFHQVVSSQILMDILYENGKYQEMLDVFKKVTTTQVGGHKYPKNVLVLFMAACYKMNTPESFKEAATVWRDMQEVGHDPMRKAVTYFAALALKQGKPELTLEILSSTKNQNYTTVRNLKVLALCKVGRIEDVMPILKSVLQEDIPTKNTYNKDVMTEIEEYVEKTNSAQLKEEFKRIYKQLADLGNVCDNTLETQLDSEIKGVVQFQRQGQFSQQRQYNYRNNYRVSQNLNQRSQRFVRPGLSDMQ